MTSKQRQRYHRSLKYQQQKDILKRNQALKASLNCKHKNKKTISHFDYINDEVYYTEVCLDCNKEL